MRIRYRDEREDNLYDFTTIKQILKISKSKLHREIHKLPERDFVKHKNQHFYKERTLFELMEKILFERINKEDRQYGLSEGQSH
jgi:DNA-binding IclR family transcriptional regulator